MTTISVPILDEQGRIPTSTIGKSVAGGVAALDADGDVVNAAGTKITGGGGTGGAVDSVNGKTGTVVLAAADVGAATSAQGAKADTAVQPTRKVAGKALSADVTLVKGDVGLGNVDNTSDANKPISTATQAALNDKATAAQGVKADTAVQPSDPRLPIVLTQAAYDALTPVAGQVYIIQG